MKFFILLFMFSGAVFADGAVNDQNIQIGNQLPATVTAELKKIGLSADDVSVYVQALAAEPALLKPPLLAHQANVALNPASIMKLLTSYASLSLLGPAYRWKTEVYTDGSLEKGILNGNLYIKGYGDPNFLTTDFWRLLSSLRQQGIYEIKGDLIIDNSFFASQFHSTATFDGDARRAYNATPSALAINLKVSSFRFDSNANQVTIMQEPNLPEIKINNQLKISPSVTKADCNAWRNSLAYDVMQHGASATITFTGFYAPNCTEKYLELLAIDENSYTLNLFRQLWQQLGGRFTGKLRLEILPDNATKLLEQNSKTLAQILPDMNKWSNNLMARHFLLTLAAEKLHASNILAPNLVTAVNEENGAAVIHAWLVSIGFKFDELVIENGSGLSRTERISAEHMGGLLVNAYYSPVMSELMSSLPILAVDGTMMKRMKDSILQGRAHLKTGSLSGVFTLAGYVLGQDSKRYVVVFMVNHAKAGLTKPAQDALLEWVMQYQ